MQNQADWKKKEMEKFTWKTQFTKKSLKIEISYDSLAITGADVEC